MEHTSEELEGEEIRIHDNWQIEFKSEFLPQFEFAESHYTQEFWFFIPNSLQINPITYSKEEFYQDQTTYLRFKTPDFSLDELISPSQNKSPIAKLKRILANQHSFSSEEIVEELKLLGNIVRSSIRKSVQAIYRALTSENRAETELCQRLDLLAKQMVQLRRQYAHLQEEITQTFPKNGVSSRAVYVEEFISDTYYHYLSELVLFCHTHYPGMNQLIEQLTQALLEEQHYRVERQFENLSLLQSSEKSEYFLYRQSLLSKFVLDALLLHSNHVAIEKKYQHYISSLAAGLAMLVYLLLFIWQGEVFRINSEPFVIFTVLIYILKDRMKEEIKNLSFIYGVKIFSDYTTNIWSPDKKLKLGKIKEFFAYTSPDKIPSEILTIRNSGIHHVLEDVKRPEQIFFVKKKIELSNALLKRGERRNALSVLFRYNIHKFLNKASNPEESYLFIDPVNKGLVEWWLPKVYHINIVLKTTFTSKKGQSHCEWHKYRLIVDKQGIRRLELV